MARGDPQLKIRLPLELKERMQAQAKANHRTMNAEIVSCLDRDVGASQELLAACRAQHRAIDWLMAMLIDAKTGFMPSKSPVWPVVLQGRAAIARASEELR